MSNDLYQETILDAYAHPENFGVLEHADVSYQEFNSSCGDDVTVYLKFSPEQRVSEITWQGVGCAISMATMSLLSMTIRGKTLDQLFGLGKKDLEELVGITEISPGREKCLLLGLKAVHHTLAIKFKDSGPQLEEAT